MKLPFPRLAQRRVTTFFIALASLAEAGMAQPATVQAQLRAEAEQRAGAARSAYAAFKRDDMAGGLAFLADTVRTRRNGAHEDLEMGRQLSSLGFQLLNEDDKARAAAVSRLALARLDNADKRMSVRDAVDALTVSGRLLEHVAGDLVQARRAYERAVTLDPKARDARQRLDFLTGIEEAARNKVAGNELLAQRQYAKGKR
jgi:tetratricopeptide (TPR) repeat protein